MFGGAGKLRGSYTYEHHDDTDDDEWNRSSTDQRREKRKKEALKRQKYEDEAKRQLYLLGGHHVVCAFEAKFCEVVGAAPGLMRATLSGVAKKVGTRALREWTEKLLAEINDLPKPASSRAQLGLYDLLPLEVFNSWLHKKKFTKDNYVVKPADLLNMEDYWEVLRSDKKRPILHLKVDRDKYVKKQWDDYVTKKMVEALKLGMVIKASEFKKRNKSQFESDGFSEADAWKEYKKTWCLLMGLKPVDSLWTFFSRVKVPSMREPVAVAVDITNSSDGEVEKESDADGPFANEEDDRMIPDYLGEDNDAGWVVAGGGSDADEMIDADANEMVDADGDDMEQVDANEMEPVDAIEMESVDANEMEPVDANEMEPVDADEED